ncbi:MAG: S1/P1 Nuclease [Pedobacter sp.]|nr:MAG: S1/P1 Nuclease [Pedobacter sp.]
MKKSSLKLLVLMLAFIYLPFNAFSWGMLGHRITGEIADQYLSKKARKAIKEILGNESIAMTSNWADFIKSDKSYDYLSPWHYVNLPENLARTDLNNFLSHEKGDNIYNKLIEVLEVLKTEKVDMEKRKLALRMVVHLMGDLHQPMHTARKEDLGGNRVNLFWFGEKTNLHRVWDEHLIEYQQLSYSEYTKAINFPTLSQFVSWQNASIEDMVYESYEVVNQIYGGVNAEDKLTYKYNFDWVQTLNQQLLKGGVRLAKVLNDTFK